MKKKKFNTSTEKRLNIQLLSPKKAELTPEGFLVGDAVLARSGVLMYFNEGELIPQEELFNEDSMNTLKLLPMTVDHPWEMVNSQNAKDEIIGHLGENIRKNIQDGTLIANYKITDPNAINLIQSGQKMEISMGYYCNTEEKEGVHENQEYARIQRDLKYNHCAVVEKGRAGKDVKILNAKEEQRMKKKIVLNSVEYEVPAEVAVEMKRLNTVESDSAELETKLNEANGRADALQEKVDSLEKQDHSERINSEVETRLSVLAVAMKLNAEGEYTGKTVREIQIEAMKPKRENAEEFFKGKDDSYVQAFFDQQEVPSEEKKNEDDEALINQSGDSRENSSSARQKMIDKRLNAHKED